MSNKPLAKTPPILGSIGGRLGPMIIMVLGLVVIGVLFLVAVMWLQNVGGLGAAGDSVQVEKDKYREKEFGELEQLVLMRCGLQEIDALGAQIDTDLTEAERLAGVYRAQFTDLLTQTKAGPLVAHAGVVPYFLDRWNSRVPDPQVFGLWRRNTNTLMRTIRLALEDEGAGYKPSQAFVDEVKLIAWKARDARSAYSDHQRLLDALARRIGEGPQADPNTIRAAVLKLEDEVVVRKILLPGNETPRSPSTRIETRPGKPAGEAAPSSLSLSNELYDAEIRRREAAERGGSTKALLKRE